VVVALGGNALSPAAGPASFAAEQRGAARAAAELAPLARAGARLLVVHGNGPQVGRLLRAPGVGEPEHLDVHVAQTQGELGYLLAEAFDAELGPRPSVALVTRVLVDPGDPAFQRPTKPVGPILAAPPADGPCARTPDGRGWRRVVASPRPLAVVEEPALRALLGSHHVVAGGGGGVPLAAADPGGERAPCAAVVDKDYVASLLARRLGAERLLLVTDVTHVYDGFGGAAARPLAQLSVAEARARLERGELAEGSMAPKVESALRFVDATGRAAIVAGLGHVEAALAGRSGTRIGPDGTPAASDRPRTSRG
jgi:carbamate kinase